MTSSPQVWWAALMAANAFEDGSLQIEDSTLDVNGGETVNLRVRLGARPRSDVTVALSETSALISLGSSSLTFTPDNWDTYQSVVVNGPSGNRQVFPFAAGDYDVNAPPPTQKSWINPTPLPAVNDGFDNLPTDNRFLYRVVVFSDGRLRMDIGGSDTDERSSAGHDLSSTFETSGSVTIEAGSDSLTALLAGADTTEPYLWTPSNSAEVTTFFNALPNTDDSQAADFILRDYVPGAATISLSASGPGEYTGVTGSATVTVN